MAERPESGPESGYEQLGSASEEAVKLLRAFMAQGGSAGPRADQHGADEHACPNGWCPVCRLADWVRDNPEMVEQVTDSAFAFARSLRDALDAMLAEKE